MKTALMGIAATLALAGCGGSGVAVPSEVVGTWGNDCAKPWMTIGSNGVMHIVPTNTDYPLKSATLSGTTTKKNRNSPAWSPRRVGVSVMNSRSAR